MQSNAKYLIPNSFTALSMLFGLASVACSTSGNFTLAAWMILWGVLLDKLDGSAARLFNASSEFGVQFDSFADFVSFGIAPAALVVFRLRDMPAFQDPTNEVLLLLAGGAFVVAVSARLARFNVSEPPGGDKIFYGIPTTLIGAIIATYYLTISIHTTDPIWVKVLPGLLVVGGVLEVSNVRLPKLKPRKNKLAHYGQIANIVFVYVAGPLQFLPEYMFFLCLFYLVVGTTWAFFNPPENPTEATEQPA
ncbi:MAG: CDP-alcohol phosphatidyltransferase family protein [Bradymonadia bacterium]